MNLDCLVTTYMYTEDQILSMLNEMHIFTHTIVRNQTNYEKKYSLKINNNIVDVFFCKDKGLSKNRNELLKLSNADFIIFSDDDEIFEPNIKEKLEGLNKSTVEVFAFNVTGNNKGRKENKVAKTGVVRKCKWKDVSSTGIWRFVIKRKVALTIRFDERIGSGTKYLCGEDSIYIRELMKKNKVLLIGEKIAHICGGNSQWFNGVNSKEYLVVKGFVYKIIYPILYPIVIARFLFKNKKFTLNNYILCLRGKKIIDYEC